MSGAKSILEYNDSRIIDSVQKAGGCACAVAWRITNCIIESELIAGERTDAQILLLLKKTSSISDKYLCC